MHDMRNKLSIIVVIVLITTLSTCRQMSELVTDDSAGLNGGFEVAQNGLPVNWLLYTPNTVVDGKFEILLDRKIYKEGEQSLRFDVEACSPAGGLNSPGFTNQIAAEPGSVYLLTFWVMNEGSEFRVSAGGVGPKTGDMQILLTSHEQINKWKNYEYTVQIEENYDQLRLEVNILKPGSFWIDDIKIREI